MDLSDKPIEFISLYASACSDEMMSAKVPILETSGDGTLIESMVIVEYLYEQQTMTAAARARARLFATLFQQWLSWFGVLKAAEGSDDETAAVQKLRAGLRALDAFLSASAPSDGPFLLEDFGLAEAACAPFLQRFFTVLPAMRPTLVPSDWVAEDGLDRLAVWVEAVLSRPSCAESLPPKDVLLDSYTKLLERMRAMPPPLASKLVCKAVIPKSLKLVLKLPLSFVISRRISVPSLLLAHNSLLSGCC